MNKKNFPLPVKIVRRGFITLFNILELPFYYLFGLFPRNKNLWIFCSWFGQRYSDNSRMFFEYVHKNHPEIKTVWLSKNMDVVKKLRAEGRKERFFILFYCRIFVFLARVENIFNNWWRNEPFFL